MYSFRSYRKSLRLNPFKLGFDDLKKLCFELYQLNDVTKNHERQYWRDLCAELPNDVQAKKDEKKAKLEKELAAIDNRCLVTLNVEGAAGELYSMIPDNELDRVFSNLNLPQKIVRIRFDNWSHYRLFENRDLYHKIEVILDFNDSIVWSFNNANQTNTSAIEVLGLDETWVLGVTKKLQSVIERNPTYVSYLMQRVVSYNAALWAVGFPGAILALRYFSKTISVEESFSAGLSPVVYLFLGLFLLALFRLFYNYLRWLFPYGELSEQQKNAQSLQRGIAAFVFFGVISGWLSLIAEFLIRR